MGLGWLENARRTQPLKNQKHTIRTTEGGRFKTNISIRSPDLCGEQDQQATAF